MRTRNGRRQKSTKPTRKKQRRKNGFTIYSELLGGGGSTCRSDRGYKGEPKATAESRAIERAKGISSAPKVPAHASAVAGTAARFKPKYYWET